MGDARFSEWFPATMRPVRSGWYEVRFGLVGGARMLFWNGRLWVSDDVSRAPWRATIFPEDEWRGLSAPSIFCRPAAATLENPTLREQLGPDGALFGKGAA